MTANREAVIALNDLSKAALSDLVIDLLRRSNGEDLDGYRLVHAITRAAEPVLAFRGDPVPTSHKSRGLPGSNR